MNQKSKVHLLSLNVISNRRDSETTTWWLDGITGEERRKKKEERGKRDGEKGGIAKMPGITARNHKHLEGHAE